MTWLGLGLKVGFAHIRGSNFKNPIYRDSVAVAARDSAIPQAQLEQYGLTGKGRCGIIDRRCTAAGRDGLQLALALNLGGDGAGLLLEPYVNVASGATAYGGYLGPTFAIHVADPLYVGFGFGLKAAWVVADGWDYGIDLYGRVPVQVTVYVSPAFALVADLGISYGGSGYASKPITYVDPRPGGGKVTALPQLSYGYGLAFDATLGFRFP